MASQSSSTLYIPSAAVVIAIAQLYEFLQLIPTWLMGGGGGQIEKPDVASGPSRQFLPDQTDGNPDRPTNQPVYHPEPYRQNWELERSFVQI